MPARIVVGVDGSDHSRRALAYAIEEARRRDATIDAVLCYDAMVYHPGMEFGVSLAPPREQLETEAEQTLLTVLREDVPADVRAEPIVAEGPPPRVLLEAASGADLLVVGSRGRGGFTGLLLGSTSHQVVSHAPCPVVVVPPAARGAGDGEGSGPEDRTSGRAR